MLALVPLMSTLTGPEEPAAVAGAAAGGLPPEELMPMVMVAAPAGAAGLGAGGEVALPGLGAGAGAGVCARPICNTRTAAAAYWWALGSKPGGA
jgi:hypothetical protein